MPLRCFARLRRIGKMLQQRAALRHIFAGRVMSFQLVFERFLGQRRREQAVEIPALEMKRGDAVTFRLPCPGSDRLPIEHHAGALLAAPYFLDVASALIIAASNSAGKRIATTPSTTFCWSKRLRYCGAALTTMNAGAALCLPLAPKVCQIIVWRWPRTPLRVKKNSAFFLPPRAPPEGVRL